MIKKDKLSLIKNILAGIIFCILLLWYGAASFIQVNSQVSYGYKQGVSTKFVAHRGLSSEYFQNTYDAFFFAEESKFFGGIECDIWRTLDGVWVCCHDDTPFVDKSIKVSESNFVDIKNLPLDTSKKGEFVKDGEDIYITLYEDFLKIMKGSRKHAFVEIKFPYSQEIIGELVDYTNDRCSISRVSFISFHKKVVERVQTHRKAASIMLLSNDMFSSYFYAKMGYNLGLSSGIIDKRGSRIDLSHKNNSFVYVYTVNSLEDAKKYEILKVDYIATDYILK
jgi:glycerophosphoryl diester phosphodiesterase